MSEVSSLFGGPAPAGSAITLYAHASPDYAAKVHATIDLLKAAAFEHPGKVEVLQRVAGDERLAVAEEELAAPFILEEMLALGGERGGEAVAHGVPVARRPDGRGHDLLPGDLARSVLLERAVHAGDRAGHIGEHRAVARIAAILEERGVVEPAVLRHARHELDELGAVELRERDDHLAVPARAARVGFHDAECHADGGRSIDGVAAANAAGCRPAFRGRVQGHGADGDIDADAEGVGAADDLQQAFLGELLDEDPVAREQAGVMHADPVAEPALQVLAERAGEARAGEGLLVVVRALLPARILSAAAAKVRTDVRSRLVDTPRAAFFP